MYKYIFIAYCTIFNSTANSLICIMKTLKRRQNTRSRQSMNPPGHFYLDFFDVINFCDIRLSLSRHYLYVINLMNFFFFLQRTHYQLDRTTYDFSSLFFCLADNFAPILFSYTRVGEKRSIDLDHFVLTSRS